MKTCGSDRGGKRCQERGIVLIFQFSRNPSNSILGNLIQLKSEDDKFQTVTKENYIFGIIGKDI